MRSRRITVAIEPEIVQAFHTAKKKLGKIAYQLIREYAVREGLITREELLRIVLREKNF